MLNQITLETTHQPCEGHTAGKLAARRQKPLVELIIGILTRTKLQHQFVEVEAGHQPIAGNRQYRRQGLGSGQCAEFTFQQKADFDVLQRL